MHRSPLSAGIYKLIERIRSIVPDAALRSSFILGYPGEKENHFNELRKFIEFARFDKLGVFPFSPEQGTSAYSMKARPGHHNSETLRGTDAFTEGGQQRDNGK